MRALRLQDVIELLREAVERAGNQSEFARRHNLQRPRINNVLNGERLPTWQLCRALGLRWVLVRQVAPSDCEAKLDIVTQRDLIGILCEEIDKAGSITAWCQQSGLDRTHVSSVLHKRRSPDQKTIAALNLSEVLVRASELPLEGRPRQKSKTSTRQHARWKKKPRTSTSGSTPHEA
jgi:DNA-binding phage protein